MNNVSLAKLLEGWVYWLFQQPYPNDQANDTNGTRTNQLNGNSGIWYLSGTWGNQGATPNKVNRNIRIKEGRSLFVVLGSSHATAEELGNPNATDQDLMQRARDIHDLWDRKNILFNGNREATQTEETGILVPWVANASYYAQIIGKYGVVRMATVGDVHLFNSAQLGNAGQQHTIVLDGHSRRSGPPLNEPEYKVDVEYRVTVIP